jgi:hypothetical protein
MCFIIHPKHPVAKIAKKDIVCYKLLWHIEGEFRSIAMNYRYKLNKLNDKIILKTISYICGFDYDPPDVLYCIGDKITIIKDGYHSYSSKRTAISELAVFTEFALNKGTEDKIHECIIPKGELYYFNPKNHEYVSTNIIIKESIN